MQRLRPHSAFATAAGIALLFSCGDQLLPDEIDCEEAVSYLEHCCPGFQPGRLACVYKQEGCSGATHPALSVDDSTCIRGESCSTLAATGVCDRAQHAMSVTYDPEDPNSQLPPPDVVCP
jgi:hypothetical protein